MCKYVGIYIYILFFFFFYNIYTLSSSPTATGAPQTKHGRNAQPQSDSPIVDKLREICYNGYEKVSKDNVRRFMVSNWDSQSESQKKSIVAKRSANRFKHEYYKWIAIGRPEDKKPMFNVDNTHTRVFLMQMGEQPNEFYKNDEDYKEERARRRREQRRDTYGRKVEDKNKEYRARGPQERNKGIGDRTPEEAAAAAEKCMESRDIVNGFKCPMCKQNNIPEHPVDVFKHKSGREFKFHPACLQRYKDKYGE